MPVFHKMSKRENGVYITHTRAFSPSQPLHYSTVQNAYDFAYNMTFGKRGEHRDHRSGGSHLRKNGEIFKDTFQGKLSECALHNVLCKKYDDITLPSFDVWELGKWDVEDFKIGSYRASVKSTKAYGNLMLLETKDFNEDGIYLPNKESNGGEYDFFIMVRIKPSCEDIMKRERLLYSEKADYNSLKNVIISQEWTYDVPGYITRDDLKEIISEGHIIRKGAILNGRTRIDANNYYVQTGDLRKIETL